LKRGKKERGETTAGKGGKRGGAAGIFIFVHKLRGGKDESGDRAV